MYKQEIEQESRIVDEQNAALEESRKVNNVQDKKFINLAQHNASLHSKLQFIESKYDFSSNVNNLNSDDLKALISTNTMVNQSVEGFIGKLDVVKDEIQKLESMKYAAY